VRREVIPFYNTAFHPNCYSFRMLYAIQSFAAGRRGVTAEEANAWADEIRQRGARGDYFFSVNRYLFAAVKP
jgi:arsenite methyltransferase